MEKSRSEAIRLGERHYFTGVPCLRGHLANRLASSGSCSDCQRERSREYARLARERGCEKLKERKRKDREKNKIKYADYMREYSLKNKDSKREYDAARYKERRDEIIKKVRDWALENKEGRRAQHRNRKHKLRNSGTHTASEITNMLRKQGYKCVYCKTSIKNNRHIDHVIPVSLGGSNEIWNLQGLCPACNMKKSNKPPEVWAKEIGILI